ncbi:type IV pilin [Halobaculum sp. EA56]|uniref:type IV pilin n=1 Tax=Halobaculum sp. EA56 TaxID=3421648 RepID=UPI003EC0B5D7
MSWPRRGPTFARDRGVTPVVATVTMVAITVVLAAVLGAAMLGVSGGLGTAPPPVSVEFTYVSDGNDYAVIASIYGGTTITKQNTGNLTLVADSGQERTAPKTRYPLTGGDDIELSDDTGTGPVPPGTDVYLVWTAPDNESTSVIARDRTPF